MKQSLKSNIIRRKRFYQGEYKKTMLKWGLARVLGQKQNYLLSSTQHAQNLKIQKKNNISFNDTE